ncbi:MAG: DUF4382 domain-containing protein, partial [Chloroflexota bacterium]|nr:DUF4382 domain-containing protein [Chloroflexota bacterium]
TQIRMVIDKVQVALGGNAPQDATVPSGALKFVRPFDVVAGQTVTLLLDFDADKSVNVTGGGKVMVKPVVKLSVKPGPKGPPQAGKAPTQTDSQQLAEEFVRNNSTFAYDGIPDSLKLADNLTAAQPPATWIFTFDFQSRHAGYGNRTGQVLAEVITPHRAVVTVEQGKIKSAVIDGKWDMLKEKMMS